MDVDKKILVWRSCCQKKNITEENRIMKKEEDRNNLNNSLNNQKEKQKNIKVNVNITQEIISETINLRKKKRHAERMKRYRERKKLAEEQILIRNKLSGMTDEEKIK